MKKTILGIELLLLVMALILIFGVKMILAEKALEFRIVFATVKRIDLKNLIKVEFKLQGPIEMNLNNNNNIEWLDLHYSTNVIRIKFLSFFDSSRSIQLVKEIQSNYC